ncbi:MAG TPA: M4 family metallopeptidase [Saprospiraceae bacterium]|nr:M4 family metallopeptidase [Saprospiraceae bacterium]
MKTFTLLFWCCCLAFNAQSQNPLKNLNATYSGPVQPADINQAIPANISPGRMASRPNLNPLKLAGKINPDISSYRVMSSGSIWIDFKPNNLWQTRSSVSDIIDGAVNIDAPEMPWALKWNTISEHVDKQNKTHIRVQQTLAGHPIKGQDMVLHIADNKIVALNGFAWTGALPKKLPDPLPVAKVMQSAKDYLISQNVKFHTASTFPQLLDQDDSAHLIWIPKEGKLVLAYEIKMHPNPMDHWTIYVNSGTSEIISSIYETCSFAPMQLFHRVPTGNTTSVESKNENLLSPMPLLDGATTVNDQDLLGQNRVVNAYQIGANFFMIDASRPSMFQPAQSKLPDDPVGTIWTIDAQNSSPQQNNFEVVHCGNTTNNWKPLEVSAHFNAGTAFEYYKNTFNRNSINGNGGNIISIINVTDENDNNMDNAFWSGAAMFYGNGNVAFTSLAKGLDVAGHEMSHGVIQNTANLEYLSQSGALNESYADVFGSLIDRDDYKMGEDVVKLNFFPSGALRDLSNPHNGGNGPGDNGWQPAHMNEYQNLPETPQGDNGGVHVNSGIPNRAYFLFANVVGKDKAEQVYYKALTDYLVKSSQFIDMRLAIEKAATDLFGGGSAEVNAAKSAFDQVGIGGGTGGNYEDDIDTNNGQDFVICTDDAESDLYIIPPGNPDQFVKMEVPAPISRPSFTDDGTACVYVDKDHNMIVISFDWSQGLNYQAFYIENNPQGFWRNIVVSKDGSRIAYTADNFHNEILVYDYENQGNMIFTLNNPTTGQGIETGELLYPDAMEWDYSGEYLMFDAFNRIESSFGNGIEYWDISFLNAWDVSAGTFGSGIVDKLFSSLPENISVGNPSFAKNSPYIITFDYVEETYDNFGNLQADYYILGANIESGTVNPIYHNISPGYPSYSRLDDKILFTYDDNGSVLLGTIGVQSADKTLPVDGTDQQFVTGAQKGVWFTVGIRDVTATHELPLAAFNLYPQPAQDYIQVKMDQPSDLPGQYEISDMTGKLMSAGQINQDRIDIHALPSGAFILELQAGQKVGRKIMVKQ